MNNILIGILNERCFVYMDDIKVYTHLPLISICVFKLSRNSYLKIQPDESEVLRKEVTYVGHIVTEDGVKHNSSKIN